MSAAWPTALSPPPTADMVHNVSHWSSRLLTQHKITHWTSLVLSQRLQELAA